MIKHILQFVLTVGILALAYLFGRHLIDTAPEAKRRAPSRPIPVVNIAQFAPQDYAITLKSRGTVSPRTQSTLIPQVSGRIVKMGDNFRDGGVIEAGELLLEIERADYELALTIAQADLASARLTLQEERAQARQAKSDWEKLGMAGKPDDLVMRKPQLAKAQATAASAEARVKQAELDLTRTRIHAPYAGQILDKQVDLGQVVSPGSQLATLYATDLAEVRLPLTDRQLGMLDLPSQQVEDTDFPKVVLHSQFGDQTWQWEGQIVRTEGSFDTRSRQLSVIAQINTPFDGDAARPPLKLGQFVTAEITGRTLHNVFVIPRQLVSGNQDVLIMDADDRVERRAIPILWQTTEHVITRDAISATDRLITTPLPYSLNGMQVQLPSQAQANEQAQSPSPSPAGAH